jgi:serine/threonine protein kinase
MIKKTDMTIKVIDYDFAQKVADGKLSDFYFGTPVYHSPEIINKIMYSLEQNQVWQLGCVLFKLFFSITPFQTKDEILTLDITKRIEDLSKHINNYIAPALLQFLAKMLSKKFEDRPTLEDIMKFNFNQ